MAVNPSFLDKVTSFKTRTECTVNHRSKMVQATTGIPVWLQWDYHHLQACTEKLSPAALVRPL